MRKISANYIYSPHTGFLKNAILEVDNEGQVLSLKPSGETFREEAGTEFYNGIICPGFINAHCHIELSHMKGMIQEGIGLHRFIHSVVSSRRAEQDEILQSISEADLQMQREGIVAVGDISNKTDSFEIKKKSRIRYNTFVEIFNMVNDQAEECFRNGIDVLEKAEKEYGLRASLVPHASYSVSEKLFSLFRERMNSENNILSIHNQESIHENLFISDRKGPLLDVFLELGMEKGDSCPRRMNSLEYLVRSIPGKNPLLLVHNVHTLPDDIEKAGLKDRKVFFCLCPNSNTYIANELPPSFLLTEHTDKVCVGTDSLSSNHKLSIISELISIQEHFPSLVLSDILNFATINGAQALGYEDETGSFENGKKPGVLLIRKADLQNLKLTDATDVQVLL